MKAIRPETMAEKLIGRWEYVGQKLGAPAKKTPEHKFEYRPVDGVRSFADVIRHVAFWDCQVRIVHAGKKGDDTDYELPKEKFSTKKQILIALERSNTDVLGALKEHISGLTPEIVEMLATFIEHNCEHYGQLVVYARLKRESYPAPRG